MSGAALGRGKGFKELGVSGKLAVTVWIGFLCLACLFSDLIDMAIYLFPGLNLWQLFGFE